MDQIQQYSAAEMERMMKVQDVLLKAMAKKITWWAAAEIIGVTDRTMRRWRERLEEGGYSGLADRRKGKPSAKRVPLATVEKMLGLYKEAYYDLNIRHFHEKLRDEHGIQLSYTWVQKALQGAGLVARGKRRTKHRRRRERRPMAGMLLHIVICPKGPGGRFAFEVPFPPPPWHFLSNRWCRRGGFPRQSLGGRSMRCKHVRWCGLSSKAVHRGQKCFPGVLRHFLLRDFGWIGVRGWFGRWVRGDGFGVHPFEVLGGEVFEARWLDRPIITEHPEFGAEQLERPVRHR